MYVLSLLKLTSRMGIKILKRGGGETTKNKIKHTKSAIMLNVFKNSSAN